MLLDTAVQCCGCAVEWIFNRWNRRARVNTFYVITVLFIGPILASRGSSFNSVKVVYLVTVQVVKYQRCILGRDFIISPIKKSATFRCSSPAPLSILFLAIKMTFQTKKNTSSPSHLASALSYISISPIKSRCCWPYHKQAIMTESGESLWCDISVSDEEICSADFQAMAGEVNSRYSSSVTSTSQLCAKWIGH